MSEVRYIDRDFNGNHPGDDTFTGLRWLDLKHLTGEHPFEGHRVQGLVVWTNAWGQREMEITDDPVFVAQHMKDAGMSNIQTFTREARLTVTAWAPKEGDSQP